MIITDELEKFSLITLQINTIISNDRFANGIDVTNFDLPNWVESADR